MSTTTKELAGLAPGTTYTYKAYGATGCGDTDLLATAAAFTTQTRFTASVVATTTATLAFLGRKSQWWYEADTGPDDTCQGPVSTTTKALAGLTIATSYSYSAYGVTGCGDTDLLATAAFTTAGMTVGNLAETSSTSTPTRINWIGGGGTTRLNVANSFTTGPQSGGYTLHSVTVEFRAPVGSPGALTVQIRSHDINRPANNALTTLSGSSPTAAGEYTFTCTTGCGLSANTTYWVVMHSASGNYTTNLYDLEWTASDDETNKPGNVGWSIGNAAYRASGNPGANLSWSAVSPAESFKFSVAAALPASLTASGVTATGATLTVSDFWETWHYMATSGPHTTCSSPVSAGTAATTLAGLTPGATYTYSAYSDSSCSTLLATTTAFTTAGVSVGNLAETSSASTPTRINWIGGGGTTRLNVANSFSTGSQSGGYTLHSVTVEFRAPVGNPGALTARIHSSAGGRPGAHVVTTLSGSSPTAAGEYTFTCTTGCGLSANTTYWLMMFSASGNYTTNLYDLEWTASDDETNKPGNAGWSIGNAAYRAAGNEGANLSWSAVSSAESFKFSVAAALPTSLTASEVSATGAMLRIAEFWETWHYMATSGPHTDCSSAVNTATTTLAGLTPGATYTYSAYSDSSCANLLATAAFTTSARLTATGVTATGATLTIEGHGAQWWYKANTSPDTTCSSAVSTTTKAVAGLAPGTSYTYSAYSDSSCANLLATAAAFTTSANLTVSDVTATTSTLTIAGHAGQWWYKADTGPDTTCSSAVSTTTKALAGLTPGTAYTYSAYGATGCGVADLLATAAFTTPARLTTSGVTATGAALNIEGHGAQWWYKANTGPDTTCQGPVNAGTATTTLTSLAPGTTYTYSAYSATGCGGTNLLATAAAFTTPVSLTVSGVTATGATLNVSGHNAQWWYKANTGPDTTCQGPVSTTTKALAGLTPGTSYTYKAYSATGCDSANLLVAASQFTTSASLTASEITLSGAKLTIAGHTGQWRYKANTGPDTACSSALSTATTTLAGLTPGASYTYSAYSDSSCASLLATTAFTTAGLSVGNLAETASANTPRRINWTNVSTRANLANSFTTGPQSGGYILQSVTVGFSAPVGTPGALTVQIRSHANNKPGAHVVTTLSGSSPTAAGDYTFSCATNCALSATSTYWLVMYSASGGLNTNLYDLEWTASNNETNSPGNAGWSIGNEAYSASGNPGQHLSWSAVSPAESFKFSVAATKPVSFTASDVTATGATLTLTGRTNDWHYRAISGPHTACSSGVSTTTTTLTGLPSGTTYTYAAYSDSSCSTHLATTVFFVPSVLVGNLGETASGNTPRRLYWAGGSTRLNLANSFSTGSQSGGYTLHSVTVEFRATVGTPGALTVQIRSIVGGVPSASAVTTLSGSNPTTAGEYTFTCATSCALSANTTYWVLMHSASGGSNTNLYDLEWTASDNETNSPGNAGWSIGNVTYSGLGNPGAHISWNAVSPAESFKFSIATVDP